MSRRKRKPRKSPENGSRIKAVVNKNWRPIGMVGGGLLLAAIAAFGMLGGLTWLYDRAQAAMVAQGGEQRVLFDWPTIDDGRSWLAESDQRELAAFAEGALGAEDQPLSDGPLQAIKTAIETSRFRGWFDGPVTIRRRPSGTIRVEANWRVPGAVVRTGRRDHLVSWSGMPMPREFDAGSTQLPVIFGVGQSPGPYAEPWRRYAEPWPGNDFAAGLALMRKIAQAGLSGSIVGVDVASFTARRGGGLVLRTTHGAALVWGGPPDSFTAGEASDDVKLGRIPQAIRFLDDLASLDRADEARRQRIDLSGIVAEIDTSPEFMVGEPP